MFLQGHPSTLLVWMIAGMALSAASSSGASPASPQQAPAASAPFSAGQAAGALPEGWQHIPFNKRKAPTQWRLVQDEGRTVLEASASNSVSMVMRTTSLDPKAPTIVQWRWKIDSHPAGADNSVAGKEDSAARLVFVFEGDKSSLPWNDRVVMRMAKTLSGQDMPYATLMYVISGVADVNTVIENPHTRRVQMIVASTARQSLGHWVEMRRDLSADFRKAFGEAPGRLIAYGVMSDTDNTASKARAWYGDIEITPSAEIAAGSPQ